jgi:hypothetical protein
MKYFLGIEINTIENIFMGAAIFFLALYLIALLVENKPKWFLSKRILECRDIEEKYSKLLNCRRDAVHHYYWAKSNNEKKKTKDMDLEVTRMDNELADLRDSYKRVKAGLPVPLRSMI